MSALLRLARFLRVRDWIVHWPVLLVLAGAYAGRAAPGFWARVPWLLGMLTLLTAGGYLVNDVFDWEADREKRGAAAPPGGRGPKLASAVVALAGGLVMAAWLPPAQRVFVGVVVALGLGYSLPVVRLKERGVLGLAGAAALQRMPAFVLMIEWPPRAPWLAGALLAWVLVLGWLFILEHQLEDIDLDRRAGVRTWAARRGRAAAAGARDAGRFALVVAATLVFAARWRTPADTAPALLVPLATLLALRLMRRRWAASRRLPVRPAFASVGPVVIHGAGLSGLVAAITLADRGVAVEVREGRPAPGTAGEGPTLVHSTLQDPAAIAVHLGLPLEPAFQRTRREIAWIGGRRLGVRTRHWNCLRGDAAGSLDRLLLELAHARGVAVRFSQPLEAAGVPAGVAILASGHGPDAFRTLGLAYEPMEGWSAEGPWAGEPMLLSYRERWTGAGYAYAAAAHGRAYALVFSRGTPLPGDAREQFERALESTAGVRFARWEHRHAVAPGAAVLERNGWLLAGAAAGFLDPFYLSGVGPALLSGGIAALAVIDRDEGRRRFRAFTRTFEPRRRAAALAWRSPPGSAGFWLAKAAALALPPVGRLHGDGTGP